MWSLKDRCVISGVGSCGYFRRSDRSEASLGLEAVKRAIDDAGLTSRDIDGFLTYQYNNDSVRPQEVAEALGVPRLRLWLENWLGGTVGASLLAIAVMAIEHDLASNVVVYRAAKHRSGRVRIGGSGQAADTGGLEQFLVPSGWANFFVDQAAIATRHMHEYGTTEEQLGVVALNSYANAQLNDSAVTKGFGPTTMEEYLASGYLAYPFRRWDFTSEVDGACAYVVSPAGRAADLPHRPVYISALSSSATPNPMHTGRFAHFDLGGDNAITGAAAYFADDLFERADLTREDIDLAMLYDASSFAVLKQLEDLGFCGKGEGGPYAASGAIALGGKLPVNTSGGLLAEGYLHGTNLVNEAVIQLRGQAGPRQVPNAQAALFTSGADGPLGGGGILTTR
jgi:acetyl-CoA acetyltransferase